MMISSVSFFCGVDLSSYEAGANGGGSGGGTARFGAGVGREWGGTLARGAGAGAGRYRPLPPGYRPRWGRQRGEREAIAVLVGAVGRR
jgi:hypothetical protein